ncbi:MAG TPA: ATP-binding cassette domain-containing protein, partial [Rhizobiaceae bacterium]
MAPTILEMRGITKTFPGVKALSNVNLSVEEGEIHAVVGENGAGKSTLMKVLSGVYPHGTYDGQIIYRGQDCHFKGIHDSEKQGIVIIHQELALVPMLSIAENIFLGNEHARFGVIDWDANEARTAALLKKVGLNEDPNTLITNIGVGKQQLVEIAKALSKEVRLLILDEPTASLSEKDSQALLDLLLEFKRQGMTSILISHKLNEVSRVADHVTVIRDGQTIETLAKAEISEDRIITSMVGRALEDRFPPREPDIGEIVFQVKDWSVYHPIHAERQIIKGIDIDVRKGEVVGIAGLMGAGRTEFAMSLFGRSYGRRITGEVLFRGAPIDTSSVSKAVEHGIAYVTEDRKTYGLNLIDHIKHNIALANLGGVSRHGVIDDLRELAAANDYRKKT